jgi:hypothetical protein
MRAMPVAGSLAAAINCVIDSNRKDGYTPTRFISLTKNGDAPDLLGISKRLINKGELLEYLEEAVKACPKLLLLEDFVAIHGDKWGFDKPTVEMAIARSQYFDQIAGGKRFENVS